MFDLVPVVAEIMKDFYPDVQAKEEFIAKVIKNEEERFHETLNEGLAILSEVIKKKETKAAHRFQVKMYLSCMTRMDSLSSSQKNTQKMKT